MKPVITIQLVSHRVSGGKSDPERNSSLHREANRTCVRATGRDRSCVEQACGGASEPREQYNCGSIPGRTGKNAEALRRAEGHGEVALMTGTVSVVTYSSQTPPGSGNHSRTHKDWLGTPGEPWSLLRGKKWARKRGSAGTRPRAMPSVQWRHRANRLGTGGSA